MSFYDKQTRIFCSLTAKFSTNGEHVVRYNKGGYVKKVVVCLAAMGLMYFVSGCGESKKAPQAAEQPKVEAKAEVTPAAAPAAAVKPAEAAAPALPAQAEVKPAT